jgi:hypothetical protein
MYHLQIGGTLLTCTSNVHMLYSIMKRYSTVTCDLTIRYRTVQDPVGRFKASLLSGGERHISECLQQVAAASCMFKAYFDRRTHREASILQHFLLFGRQQYRSVTPSACHTLLLCSSFMLQPRPMHGSHERVLRHHSARHVGL